MKDNKKLSRFFDIKPRSFVKLSSGVVERIFSEFSFRTLNKKSSSNLIYKNIVNTAFGANIIMSMPIDAKHTEFYVNTDICDLLTDIEKLCAEHTNKNIDIGSRTAQICCETEEELSETTEDIHLRLESPRVIKPLVAPRQESAEDWD
jgi:hypothetical protein